MVHLVLTRVFFKVLARVQSADTLSVVNGNIEREDPLYQFFLVLNLI